MANIRQFAAVANMNQGDLALSAVLLACICLLYTANSEIQPEAATLLSGGQIRFISESCHASTYVVASA